MPFASLGVFGFSFIRGLPLRVLMQSLLVVAAVVSVAINLIGAMQGAMLCDFREFAAGIYLSQMLAGGMKTYPLAELLALPFLVSIILLAIRLLHLRKGSVRV